MRIGIMQPYAFPYIGYWQLINSVDKFVLLDDVNHIRRGWVNRNEMADGKFTIPLHKASQNKQIRELYIVEGGLSQFLYRVERCYAKSPYLKSVLPLLDRRPITNLSQYIHSTILGICHYLGIETEIVATSSVYPVGGLRGQDRILDICMDEGARMYVNPIGGTELYSEPVFIGYGIDLKFIRSYSEEKLSIIDLLMRMPPEQIRIELKKYELVCKHEIV